VCILLVGAVSILSGTCFIAILLTLDAAKDFRASSEILNIVSGPLPSLKLSFCQTSCTDSCSTYMSVYGQLCCNWAEHQTGERSCTLRVEDDGICTCGVPHNVNAINSGIYEQESDKTDNVPAAEPSVMLKSTQTSGGNTESSPTTNSNSIPIGGGGYHPYPTMSWNWNPYPTMAWIPFNPITIPSSSTPCKHYCRHPCGWSSYYGESLCCETSQNGGCDMAQINGQCYCA